MIKKYDDFVSYRKLTPCIDKARFDRNHSTYKWNNSVYYTYVYMYGAYSRGCTTFLVIPKRKGN